MADASLTLSAGALELELSPRTGGSIVRFERIDGANRVAVLRRAPDSLDSVLDAASFPLVPYVNRIRDGRFCFGGREVALKPNMEGDPSPLHGQGWLNPWTVEEADESSAALRFKHEPGEWPWAYESLQRFALAGDSLDMTISCRNLSDEPMPCGLGIHPYFNCGPETRIRTSVEHVWTVDEDVLPIERIAATGRYDIADAPVCGRDLDNGYDGWSGVALFTDPRWPFDIELSSKGCRCFQLYSPAAGGIFVAEPVTHANDALSQPEARLPSLGIRILGPGESMDLEARLTVRPK